jgi:diadenosine tetraphosphatase ApaH/serine/threonine PP2A family protein phosphatase
LEKPWFVKTVNWARDQLSSNNLAYLNAFRPSLRLTPNAGVSIYCIHGTLRSNEEGIFPNTPDDELENMIPCNKPTAVVCGHTHVQMYRLHKGIPIVNVGSVGMPFGYPLSQPPCYLPWAEYAIIEVNELSLSVNLKRVSVDFDAMIEMSEGQEYAGRPYWLKAWRKPNSLRI